MTSSAPDTLAGELQVRAAEASTVAQAAELLGEDLHASIPSSDLADLRSTPGQDAGVLVEHTVGQLRVDVAVGGGNAET